MAAAKGVDPETTDPAGENVKKLGDVRITFDHFRRAEKTPDLRGIVYIAPEEVGFDREELGFGPLQRIAWVIRPFKAGENAEIREEIKDFSDETRLTEYYDEIVRRCSVEPEIPDSVEGRKALARMLPGTKQVIAQAVIDQSGMGLHDVRSAREELGKLPVLTTNTPSNSA